MQLADWQFYGNTLRTWVLASVVALIVFSALRVLRGLVVRRFTALAAATENEIDDVAARVLQRTHFLFLLFLALYAASRVLILTGPAEYAVRVIGVVVITLQAALWGEVLISAAISRRITRADQGDGATATTMNALAFLSRLALWSLLLLMALANLGVEIGPLLAGLGVGGVAVALALQNILGDLFASLSIVLDKPFVVGDFIVVDDLAGTVDRVGLKTTRVRSLSGEQLIFSNADLLGSRIRNFKRMRERRVAFKVGLTYQTPHLQLARIPDILREIIDSRELARFDRAHFQRLGDFSLDFEVVYYVRDPDYNRFMDVQQEINLEIYRRFGAEGIEFAYPTQTLYLEGTSVLAAD